MSLGHSIPPLAIIRHRDDVPWEQRSIPGVSVREGLSSADCPEISLAEVKIEAGYQFGIHRFPDGVEVLYVLSGSCRISFLSQNPADLIAGHYVQIPRDLWFDLTNSGDQPVIFVVGNAPAFRLEACELFSDR
jgi:quercetin dioxygenase-like cupin family protein